MKTNTRQANAFNSFFMPIDRSIFNFHLKTKTKTFVLNSTPLMFSSSQNSLIAGKKCTNLRNSPCDFCMPTNAILTKPKLLLHLGCMYIHTQYRLYTLAYQLTQINSIWAWAWAFFTHSRSSESESKSKVKQKQKRTTRYIHITGFVIAGSDDRYMYVYTPIYCKYNHCLAALACSTNRHQIKIEENSRLRKTSN